MIRISIDRGGTFTDVYAHKGGEDYVFKLLSVDPRNYPDAPAEGIRRVLEHFRKTTIPRGELLDLHDIESIRMGTTVATNALLERKGKDLAFIVTKGFRDILQIGQQCRPNIFDLSVAKLGVLYKHVFEIDERVTMEGYSEDPEPQPIHANGSDLVAGLSGEVLRIIKPLEDAEIERVLDQVQETGVTSIALALMHSYIYPEHEQRIAELARKRGFDVSVSSEILPMIKLVSRASSASADGYLSPVTREYVQNFGKAFKGGLAAIGDKLLFMQSDGGLATWSKFSGLRAILSGPAGGVVGYAGTSETDDNAPILGFDMGGTSTDVSRYANGFEHVFETTTAQVTIHAPQLNIDTVAAGGGSILTWRRGLFCVGPESASSHPGPACYRKGGPLTVTDANLLLGRIYVDSFPKIFGPNADEPLDVEIVKQKFAALTKEINADKGTNLTPEQVASGFLAVANESMCRPIRSLTQGKGYVASAHNLASFGGAGGQHACAVAKNLGISRVIIHKYSSILSAYGIAIADIVSELQRPQNVILSKESIGGLDSRITELSKDVAKDLVSQGVESNNIDILKYVNCCYKGSETKLMIPFVNDYDQLRSAFVDKHAQEFGFSLERPILINDVRCRGVGKSASISSSLSEDLRKYGSLEIKETPKSSTVKAFFDDNWCDTQIYLLKDLPVGYKVKGPAMILDNTQTLLVDPSSVATILPSHVVINIEDTKQVLAEEDDKKVDPILLSVFANRFMSIAEQMGETLQKTAISTNIKERLDFSCAIFSPDGGLVANAPHIPVHLGSMSSAVEYQVKYWEGKLNPGDVLVCNHPAYGGTHLPDITVVTPVFASNGKDILFWSASRGHHSDIGGITAGSMPPFSKELWEEGTTIEAFKIVKDGVFDEDGIFDLMYVQPAKYPGCEGSRSLSDSISDLKAQIAANHRGIGLLSQLIEDYGLSVVQKYMFGIQKNAEHSVRHLLKSIANEKEQIVLSSRDFVDDGTNIDLKVTIDGKTGSAVFDFAGTGPETYGNLNTPKAITMSAILYCLRCMVKEEIPLNQGCLVPIDIQIPENCFLNPRPESATVGSNVETCQRIVDVIFRAFGTLAGSQGTCNNLTFGYGDSKRKGFGYYETIAGGAGAGPSWNGQSGVQVHMTNTRATDPEVFEKRYPVILREFSIRKGSGGKGKFTGGDGTIRDVEFRIPVQVSILSERRVFAPYGLEGGEEGAKGQTLWIHGDKTISMGGKNTCQFSAGDRVIVRTPGGGGYGKAN